MQLQDWQAGFRMTQNYVTVQTLKKSLNGFWNLQHFGIGRCGVSLTELNWIPAKVIHGCGAAAA